MSNQSRRFQLPLGRRISALDEHELNSSNDHARNCNCPDCDPDSYERSSDVLEQFRQAVGS